MASIRIELPRKCWQIYFKTRYGKLIHRSSGILHSPDGATAEERKQRAQYNRNQAVALAADLELAEDGSSTAAFIRTLFDAALQRAMGVYGKKGRRGMSIKNYLDAWLKLQTHLNESRKHYQAHINVFCEHLKERSHGPLFELEPRHIQEFIDSELAKGLAATTINNKLRVLDAAFTKAVKSNLMLCNIVDEEDYLEEERLKRKPFTREQLKLLHQRWADIAKSDTEAGSLAREWMIASKLAAFQGMRIGDATQQIRGNIDFDDGLGFVVWTPEKTAHLQRVITLPLHSIVRQQLLPFKSSERDTKLTPRLAKKHRPDLCTAFKLELKATDIDPEDYQLTNRVFSAVSFHSHKHFYVNSLEKAGVPQDRRKQLSAHSSDSAHSRYLHAWSRGEAEALRTDLELLKLDLPVAA